jgi:hypothetical protein
VSGIVAVGQRALRADVLRGSVVHGGHCSIGPERLHRPERSVE